MALERPLRFERLDSGLPVYGGIRGGGLKYYANHVVLWCLAGSLIVLLSLAGRAGGQQILFIECDILRFSHLFILE